MNDVFVDLMDEMLSFCSYCKMQAIFVLFISVVLKMLFMVWKKFSISVTLCFIFLQITQHLLMCCRNYWTSKNLLLNVFLQHNSGRKHKCRPAFCLVCFFCLSSVRCFISFCIKAMLPEIKRLIDWLISPTRLINLNSQACPVFCSLTWPGPFRWLYQLDFIVPFFKIKAFTPNHYRTK